MSLIITCCTSEGNFIAGDTMGSIDWQWSTPSERKISRTDGGVIIGFAEGAAHGKQIVNNLRNRMNYEISAMSWAQAVQLELNKKKNIPDIELTFLDDR